MSTDRRKGGLRWLAVLALLTFVAGIACDLARGPLLWGQAPGASQPSTGEQPATPSTPEAKSLPNSPGASKPEGSTKAQGGGQAGEKGSFRSPLIKALDAELARLSKTNPELADSDDDARAILKDADEALARIKAENRAAIDRLNRRAAGGQMLPPRPQRAIPKQKAPNQQAARPNGPGGQGAGPAQGAVLSDAQAKAQPTEKRAAQKPNADKPNADKPDAEKKSAAEKPEAEKPAGEAAAADAAVDPRRPADPRDRLPTIVIR
ncbi:MAG TPA: hypothetical protein PLV92_19940, partial [Pirellulaceae bacterium]|nr:hypothetical protein [Pirellulaceae bacterium]